MKTFLLRYEYEGHWYCFELQANSWDDLTKRVSVLSSTTVIDGELVMSFDIGNNN